MGQIIRLLIIAIVIWIVVQLIRRVFFPPVPKSDNSGAGQTPRMLRCDRCGVHVPETHALRVAEKIYCSKEHLPD